MVRYEGVPRTYIDPSAPDVPYGWIHTDDGSVVVSEPEGSANWFPVNDHPTDKAAFTFVVIYPWFDFGDPISGDSVVVHETAHQWYGDSVALAAWKHMWLNEGFATYAEWLWSGREGLGTPQEIFDFFYHEIPADDPFWDVVIGDPGIPNLFNGAVYVRGAMTLQTLRNQVGDRKFFRILRAWATRKAGGNGTTAQFVALAERISGQQLDELFDAWLFTPAKPALGRATAAAAGAASRTPPAAASLLRRLAEGELRVRR